MVFQISGLQSLEFSVLVQRSAPVLLIHASISGLALPVKIPAKISQAFQNH